jgi:epoxyqueuosine reductase
VASDPVQLGREVVTLALEQGFALAGIAAASPSKRGRELREWLSAGRHGSMGYMAEHVEARLDPGRILPGARSVLMVADLYAPRAQAPEASPAGMGRIARYARGRDYHRVMKRRLHALSDLLASRHAGAAFRAFVDTAPVMEREHASRAGLGWPGKHTLLIHPRLGSFLLLGGVLTTVELAPPPEQATVMDHCGTCTRCIDACPTQAIRPNQVDATRCISYLTIERRLPIDPALHGAMGDWLYGCDICQEVCPHNSPRAAGVEQPAAIRPEYAPRAASMPLLEVLGWREEDRRAAFEGSAMKRATLAMMKRNAVIIAGNQIRRGGTPGALLERIRHLASDPGEPELVRSAAAAVLASLDGEGSPAPFEDGPPDSERISRPMP